MANAPPVPRPAPDIKEIPGNQHGAPDHDAAINDKAAEWDAQGYTDIRKNQAQVDVDGNGVSNGRPDLQGINPNGVREIFEAGRSQDYLDNQAGARKQADPNASIETKLLK